MQGNFTYHNPTRVHFGREALEQLASELAHYGPRVLLVYGSCSIKSTGLYQQVVDILSSCGKEVQELPNVLPNPTITKITEGVALLRNFPADLILAVGGGSVIDYAKALSASVHCPHDPWQHYFIEGNDLAPEQEYIPVGAILTLAATGSEMNGGAVITNPTTCQKLSKCFDARLFPQFAILNPEWLRTLPESQLRAGIFDILAHLLEQFFSGENHMSPTDYMILGLVKSIVQSADNLDFEQRDYRELSDIMWTASWALNTLLEKGKPGDWMLHMIGESIGGSTNATHGFTLSGIALPYYRRVAQANPVKFAQFVRSTWGEGRKAQEACMKLADSCGESHTNCACTTTPESAPTLDSAPAPASAPVTVSATTSISTPTTDLTQINNWGLEQLAAWMQRLQVVTSLRPLGVTPELIPQIARNTVMLDSGYVLLDTQGVVELLTEALDYDIEQ